LSERAGLPAALRWTRPLSVLTLAVFSLALASCQEARAFGMPLSLLQRTLAGDDASPILGLDEGSLDDPGPYGPAGCYYLALWLESRAAARPEAGAAAATADSAASEREAPEGGEADDLPDSTGGPAADPAADPGSVSRRLLRCALERGKGIVRERAAYALMERLEDARLYDELLALTNELDGAQGRDWRVRRAGLEALDALGKDDDSLEEVAKLRIAFPEESKVDADALDCIEAAARIRKGPSGATTRSLAAMRRVMLDRPASEWTARALAIAEEGIAAKLDDAAATLSADEARAVRMRIAAREKDYARAYKEAAATSRAAISASAPMVADAGKAYLYSGMSKEGAARFSTIEDAARESGAKGVAWTALFYRGRFARSLEKWGEAAKLFARAAAEAAGVPAADAEAARWYAAECAGKSAEAEAAASIAKAKVKIGGATARRAQARARGAALDALISASKAWSDPSAFSDLADGLLRAALRARDWDLIERMNAELAPRLSPTLRARTAYAAARASELGLSKLASGGLQARDRLASIARDESAPLYYRALASWRSGEPISAVPTESAPDTGNERPEPGEIENLINGLADFDLGNLAASEARRATGELESAALRRIAASLAGKGMHDYSLRVASALVAKEGYAPCRDDYLLLYPRPYLKEIRGIDAAPAAGERLILGLVRSESAFCADAVSRAGAIGLTQLMPATAADQAKALGMKAYDLYSPEDNLRIGIAHFSYLIDKAGTPLRAMMAYNAGMTRLKAWTAEGEALPDDLLVESLTISETRQYCRNILQAAVMYGELYEGVRPGATVQRIVEGK